MRRAAILLAGVFVLLGLGTLVYALSEGRIFTGCSIHLVSDSNATASWQVRFRGATRSGSLAPSERADVRLCTFGPRDFPPFTLTVAGRGNATAHLDPWCSDWSFAIRDSSIESMTPRVCA